MSLLDTTSWDDDELHAEIEKALTRDKDFEIIQLVLPDDLETLGYEVQDIDCCCRCTHSDVVDLGMVICMISSEEVSPIGICKRYETESN